MELELDEAEVDISTTFDFVGELEEADDDALAFGLGKIVPAFFWHHCRFWLRQDRSCLFGCNHCILKHGSGLRCFRGGSAAMQSFLRSAVVVFAEPPGIVDSARAEPFLGTDGRDDSAGAASFLDNTSACTW